MNCNTTNKSNAERIFILGEEKYIDFKISSTIAQAIVITSANYKLSKNSSGGSAEINISGDCEIDGDIISALIEPPEKGTYTLEVNYEIAMEKRKARIRVQVI